MPAIEIGGEPIVERSQADPLDEELVESHGGRVWIDSAPGHGTTLFFTWSERT